jgi:hypothetical protein
VTTEAAWPVIAAVIGTHRFASFPLIPYLPWFLLGIWFAANPLRWWHAIPALAATAGFAYVTMTAGAFPERFPPSALWVIGAAAPLLVYWAASRAVARAVSLPGWLLLPGRHVLSFLVLSNLVIFGSRFFFGRLVRDTFTIALVALAIVCGLSIIWLGIELLRARRGVQTPAAVRS